MRAIVSDRTAQRGSLTAAPVLLSVSLRRFETDGFALGVRSGMVTGCKITGDGGWPVQIPANTGQIWPVTVGRGQSGFGKSSSARHLRAKTLAEPEVTSRGSLFRKDQTVQFREAQDEVSGR